MPLPAPVLQADPVTVLHAALCRGRQRIVQVGANDGMRDDPVSPLMRVNPALQGLLIEPLPGYFRELSLNYGNDRHRVQLLNCAVAAADTQRVLYHLDEQVADEMDGDGPPNGWAHGQGSFTRDTVVTWIHNNSFRGERYRASIPRYVAAIRATTVECLTLSEICRRTGVDSIDALVIDVQGHELDVLRGLDFTALKPTYIYYEDDLKDSSDAVAQLLLEHRYTYVCGDLNKLWWCASGSREAAPSGAGAPRLAGSSDGPIPMVGAANEPVPVDVWISACSRRDLTTWAHLQQLVLTHVSSRSYRLIVPREDASLFRAVTSSAVEVVAADSVLSDRDTLAARLPAHPGHGAEEFLQQLARLAAAATGPADGVALFWDLEAAPIRPLHFIGAHGQLIYHRSSAGHPPHLATLQRLTGIESRARFSFIAQCLPARVRWVRELVELIERRAGKPWSQAILESLQGQSPSAFNDCETLGQFAYDTHRAEMELRDGGWHALGFSVFGNLPNFRKFTELDYFVFRQSDPALQKAQRG